MAYEMVGNLLRSFSSYFGPWGRGTLDCYYMMSIIEERRGNPDKAEYVKFSSTMLTLWIDQDL
jgi:hypothetical protein